jgi:hypothetical protein
MRVERLMQGMRFIRLIRMSRLTVLYKDFDCPKKAPILARKQLHPQSHLSNMLPEHQYSPIVMSPYVVISSSYPMG